MTPAEELLAAVVKHATADVYFTFDPKLLRAVAIYDGITVIVRVGGVGTPWTETTHGYDQYERTYHHASASSAVYSAFLRARGKQL